jgi:prepilin-type N-terminal cleavage/methylation domain-containing protein
MNRRTRGFSLVELLVVIGLVGLLLGLLLPAFSIARQYARRVECASNLRQIAALATGRATAHRGYLALDGEVEISPEYSEPGSLAEGLSDPSRQRYAYTDDEGAASMSADPPTMESPTPLLVALLQDSSPLHYPADPGPAWPFVEARTASARVFHCPSADRSYLWVGAPVPGTYSLILFVGGTGYPSSWYTTFDYATNGGLLGLHFDPAYANRRYGGALSRVTNSSRMVLCGDCGARGLDWIPTLAGTGGRVTLLDVL